MRIVYSHCQIYGVVEGPTSRMAEDVDSQIDCNDVRIEKWLVIESAEDYDAFPDLFSDSAFIEQ